MVVWIEDCSSDDTERVGQKAAYLGELFQHDFSIPTGFVIPRGMFHTVLEHNNLAGQIRSAVRDTDLGDRHAVERASRQIASIVQDAAISEEIKDEIRSAYSEIHVSKGIRDAGEKAVDLVGSQRGTGPVAVRASVGEPETGFFPGEIGVNTVEDVFDAVKEVWASFFSPASLMYHETVDPLFRGFPVIVQDLVEPDASGFVFLDTAHDSTILVESYNGIGTLLREGGVDPDSWSIDRADGRIRSSHIAEKHVKMQKDPRSGRFERSAIPSHERQERSIDADQLTDVVNKALEIQGIIGESLRIGFAVRSGSVFFTTVLPAASTGLSVDAETGRITSTGETVTGMLTGEKRTGDDVERIAVSDTADDVFLAVEEGIAGIVARKGAISSRACTAALMRGRPLMVQAGDLVADAPQDARISIDFGTGTISQPERLQQDAVSRESMVVGGARPASRMIAVGGRVDSADGVLELNPGFDVAGKGRLQIGDRQVMVVDSIDAADDSCLLVQGYGEIFALVASDRRPETVLVDVASLYTDAGPAAVSKAFETLVDVFDGRVAALMQRFDETLARNAVSHGVDMFAIPSERVDSFSSQLDRVERQFLLERLRSL